MEDPERQPEVPSPLFDTYFPDDENGVILRRMQAQGVEMDRAHEIDFFFVFPDRANADAFHRALAEPLATDSIYEGEGCWFVCVSKFVEPTHRGINEMQERLIHLAVLHSGKSGGWSYDPK